MARLATTLAVLLVSFTGMALAAEPMTFWRQSQRANAQDYHQVTLLTKLSAHAAASCDAELMAVSTPGSPRMGKHYTFEQLKRFTNWNSHNIVKSWARAQTGLIVSAAPNGEFIEVTGTIENLERAFGASFYEFEAQRDSSIRTISALHATPLPAAIAAHVDVTAGFNFLAVPHANGHLYVRKMDQAGASGTSTPQAIWTQYNINDRTVADKRATSDIFASLGQNFDPQDLAAFQQAFNLPNTPVAQVEGQNDPANCTANVNNCVEASLDVQQVTALAQGTNLTFWSIPSSINNMFLYWITTVAADSNAPLVHSVSYGSLAPEDDPSVMKRFNTEVCKMGLRGLTICVASGDDGVANFAARQDQTQCGFTPSYPATCPYVTAVGATMGPESGLPEVGCQADLGGGITSGGGFSIIFKTPVWQHDQVKAYLAKGTSVNLPPLSQFNSAGRGYPDVSSMGHNFPIQVAGNMYTASGTSASSPDFAAMVTLVNGLRFKAGKGPIGFLNPTIYGTMAGTSAFNDITVGRNNCCAGDPSQGLICCQYGFNATAGWDPMTGVGTVNFPSFSKALINA